MKLKLISIMSIFIIIQICNKNIFAIDAGIGVNVGINLSKFYGEDSDDDETILPGITGGASVALEFNNIFSIEPGIIISSKGVNCPDVENVVYYYGERFKSPGAKITNAKSRLIYLEVPILLKISYPSKSSVKPSIYAGPSTSFLLSAKQKADADVVEVTTIGSNVMIDEYNKRIDSDIKDKYSIFDFGINTGINIDINAGPGKVIIAAGIILGLLNVDDEREKMEKNFIINMKTGYVWYF